MPYYYWENMPVEVLQQYAGVYHIKHPKTGRKEVVPDTLIQVSEEPPTLVVQPPIAYTAQEKPAANTTPQLPATTPQLEASPSPTPIVIEPEPESRTKELININELTPQGLATAGRKLPGVGKKTLEVFLENKPEGGYIDLEHLKKLNEGKTAVTINWKVLSQYLTFVR